jgi:Rps23 Pro-64 3,4-dihydroxylase Tpa1-like proline 4-hydroxylase
MKLVTVRDNFIVIDNLLAPDVLQILCDFVMTREFEFKNSRIWDKVWRLSDGRPLIETSIHMYQRQFTYNPSAPYDIFAAHLLAAASDVPLGSKWSKFSVSANIYPTGTSLSWHDDGKAKIGAYSFYIHPEWNVQWGGELMIADHCPIESTELDVNENSQCLYNKTENDFLLEIGMGTYIFPKPNRLVILSSRTLHAIREVNSNAGDRARLSLQGFFVSDQ